MILSFPRADENEARLALVNARVQLHRLGQELDSRNSLNWGAYSWALREVQRAEAVLRAALRRPIRGRGRKAKTQAI